MVDALEGAAQDWGVPKLFLGTIVIPIVGNAAEVSQLTALRNQVSKRRLP